MVSIVTGLMREGGHAGDEGALVNRDVWLEDGERVVRSLGLLSPYYHELH